MGWIVNLSNGETIIEKAVGEGQRSSWQQLLEECRETGVAVTGIRLSVRNITVSGMPPKACDGYFQAYESSRSFYGGKIRHMQGIGSIVGDSVYITWINLNPGENEMNYVYQDVRPLKEVSIHTTKYEV